MTDTIHIQKDTIKGSIYIGKLNPDNKWTGFGQVSYNNGLKLQGIFKEGELNGLALVIQPDGKAVLGKFKNGVKEVETKDDETMYIYDELYTDFKDSCSEQGIKFFQWIEGEDDVGESDSGLPEEEEDFDVDMEEDGIEIQDYGEKPKIEEEKIPETKNGGEEEVNDLGFSSMKDDADEDRGLDDIKEEPVERSEEKEVEEDKVEVEVRNDDVDDANKNNNNEDSANNKKFKRRKKRRSPSKVTLEGSPRKNESPHRTLTPAKRVLSTGEVITPVLDNVNKRDPKRYSFVPSNHENYLDPRNPSQIPLDDYLNILSRENHILNYYKSYLERNPKLAKRFLKKFRGIKKMRNLRDENYLLGGLDIGFTAKDLEDLKRKYGLAALSELEKLGWSKDDLERWNRKYGGDMDEDLRKKFGSLTQIIKIFMIKF